MRDCARRSSSTRCAPRPRAHAADAIWDVFSTDVRTVALVSLVAGVAVAVLGLAPWRALNR